MKKLVAVLALLLPLVTVHAATVTVFSTNQTWRYAPGTAEASTPISAWRSNSFNDSSFVNSSAPFWYDVTGDTSTRVGGTQIVGMQNTYLCIFLRKQFVLANTPYTTNLQLNVCVDDGIVAWINGAEVLRINPPPEPFTISSSVATAAPEPVMFTTYTLPPPAAYLDPSGTNVLTVQVFNAANTSSDLDFDAELLATTATPVNLLAPGNPIIGVAAAPGSAASVVSSVGTAAGANNYPSNENPPSSIDASTSTKYLNFAKINCGFIVTIPNNQAKVNGIQFTAANDAAERDPITVSLEGTSSPDPTTAAAGSTWVPIYSGPSGLSADPGRFNPGATISFINPNSFNTFRLLITDVRNAGTANSMQFSEIQFQGSFASDITPPTLVSFSPPAGTVESPLSSITVHFSEPVSGVDASDLLLNGTPAAGVTGGGTDFVFSFAPLPLGPTTVTFANTHGIADFGVPPNPFDATNTWQYTVADTTAPRIVSYLPPTNTVVRTLTRVEVLFSEPVTGVDPGDLLINGVPATGIELGVPGQYAFTFTQPATGVVQVAWAPGHGITDFAPAPNSFAGGSWTYTLDPNAANDVRINEFMTDNQNGIRDEDGSHEDWIELYNAGVTSVSLAGYYLTDDVNNLTKWRFPAGVQMLANSYLLVWASAKDRTNNVGALHTNFKLNKDGSFLGLVLPNGVTVISSFGSSYPAQRTDASYGRDRLDPNIVGFYNTPTPNAPNPVGGVGDFAPDVTFSLSSKTFVNPFNLTLSTTSTNAQIRYVVITTAAQASASITNVPTTNSTLYTGPIPISVTTEIRARAFQTGLFPGTPRTESYIQVSSEVQNFNSDVPVCIVHMLGNGSIPTTATSGILMAFDNDSGRSALANPPQTASRMGVHIRGSSTINNAKSNLRVETWDEFNQDAKYPLLGQPADSDWVFYGINQFDPGLMHNAIYQWLGRSLGIFNMRTRYVEMFRKIDNGPVTTNDYFGLYLFLETPKVGNDRVDIATIHNTDTNAPGITGGYILKIDRVDNEKSFTPPQIGSIRPTPSAIAFTDPPYLASESDPRRLLQTSYLQSYVLSFITNLSTAGTTNPVTGYAQYINPDQWVNHLIANIVPFNVDGYRLSGFFYKDRNGRLEQGPMWDCDRCMGTGGSGATPNTDNRCFSPRYWRLPASDVNTDNGTDFFGVSNVGVSWFTPLFRDPDFWQRFIDRYQNVRTNEYSSNSIVSMLDGFYTNIKESQVREQARWGPAGFTYPRSGSQTVNGYTFDFGPPDNLGRGRFTNEVNFQKKWFLDRFEFIDTNFLAMPTLSLGSALVTAGTTITAAPAAKANSQLLYTLNGTDPRLPGGAVSPSALTSAGPLALTISTNVRLFARSYNTSHANMTNSGTEVGKPLINSYWSGPVAASYYTALPPLRITELMYHPQNPPAGNTNDPDNFEYIEVKNISGASLNVNGFRIRGGVDFVFPNTTLAAGQAAVVVKHAAAFQSRYGGSPLILGTYSNNLANSGDHLVLEGAYREPILDFSFSDSWYPITDGAGYSLQIVDDNLAPTNWGFKASWRPSGSLNGTPGTSDPGALSVATIYINELLAHTNQGQLKAIELFNPNPTIVNISGWFLTDNFNDPKRYRIPASTTVPANGYLVLNADTSFGSVFDLSAKGSALYIFSGDANTNLTGYVHGFDYGPQAGGVTFGRHVISTGSDQFPAQSAPTLGSANAGPKVGPIVISEIMYHPPDIARSEGPIDNTRDEYIELQNISGVSQPLYDPQNPANTWRVRDAVDFTFPTNVSIPPNGRLLLVSFDPSDAQALNGFRARNSASQSAQYFGPYSGQLDNSTDSIELVRPDAPQPTNALDANAVYYILTDKVKYQDSSPWPTNTDGTGYSLQRVVLSNFGNDPANWVGTNSTPGKSATGGAGPVITSQPQNTTVLGTLTAMFSVSATGTPPLFYQWKFGALGIPGATNSLLLLPNVQPNQAGSYHCDVEDGNGNVTFSSSGILTVLIPANITQHPTNTEIRVRPDTSTDVVASTNAAMYLIASTQNPPLTYQWRMNGTNLLASPHYSNVTAATLIISNVTIEDYGDYSCAVTDLAGTIFSTNGTLYPLVRPTILIHPATQTVPAFGAVPASVVLSNGFPPPFRYIWYRASNPFMTNISDSKTNFQTIPGIIVSNLSSAYTVRLTNRALTSPVGANSASFTLTVVADTDFDGMPDSYEQTYSGSTTGFLPGGDADGDGMSNLAEYLAGTDPSDPASYLKINQTITPGVGAVNFGATSNHTYTVQYTDVLPAVNWQRLADVVSRPSNRVEQFIDPGWSTKRFYRVVTPRAP